MGKSKNPKKKWYGADENVEVRFLGGLFSDKPIWMQTKSVLHTNQQTNPEKNQSKNEKIIVPILVRPYSSPSLF